MLTPPPAFDELDEDDDDPDPQETQKQKLESATARVVVRNILFVMMVSP
jgi:hypothetical protein